jgi:tetratricopeptide (TPR) repeat protein
MHPDRATAWLELGRAFVSAAGYADAKKALDRSISLCSPEHMRYPYLEKGFMYRSQGRFKLAERWFRRCLELDSKDADAWAFLGSSLARQGKFKGAKAAWRRQVRLGTGATDGGHLNLGLILRAEGRYKEALQHAERALELDAQYQEARELRKDLLEVLGDGI